MNTRGEVRRWSFPERRDVGAAAPDRSNCPFDITSVRSSRSRSSTRALALPVQFCQLPSPVTRNSIACFKPSILPVNPPLGANIPASRSKRSRSGSASRRSEEHTSELQSLMRLSYAVFCLKKTKNKRQEQQI